MALASPICSVDDGLSGTELQQVKNPRVVVRFVVVLGLTNTLVFFSHG